MSAWEAVDAILHAAIPKVAPGAQLEVWHRFKPKRSLAIGHLAPGQAALKHDSLFDLASLTKVLSTTLLVMKAVEDGELHLDDRLDRYLPAAHPHRILDLLEHASGLVAHQRLDLAVPDGCADPRRWMLEAAGRIQPSGPPGERAVYSDIGFILLGALLEAIYGLRQDALQAALFPELGYRPQHVENIAWTHPNPERIGQVHDDNARAMEGVAGHAGLFGSARQVAKAAHAILAWQREREPSMLQAPVLQAASVDRMFTPSAIPGSTRCLGWDRPSRPGYSATGPSWPESAVGHLGFTGTSLWISPKDALVVVLLCHRVLEDTGPDGIRKLRADLHEAIWQALD